MARLAEYVKNNGLFSSCQIEELIANRTIRGNTPIEKNQLQPASLDLRLGATAYRVRASFLPGQGALVKDKINNLCLHEMHLTNGAVLEVGCVYIIPIMEFFELPSEIAASANPKSSTGRLNVFTRLIADNCRAFDILPAGYHGHVYLEVSPRSFPILLYQGSRLNQIRFHQGNYQLTDKELISIHKKNRIVDTEYAWFNKGIHISVDLSGTWSDIYHDALVGYRAKRYTHLIDIDKVNTLSIPDFWDPIKLGADANTLTLDPGEFYILASIEGVRIPPTCAAELIPFDQHMGEFRVHYAGFFDPGFGYTKTGQCITGARAVLEVSSREVPFILEHRQTIGRLVFNRLQKTPHYLYGGEIGSSYQCQGLKLSKHFRS